MIISEPSNPWIAGVASPLTHEFFAAARDRLAPGRNICQWAHTYNISDRDLRSIVATFLSVFPNGTAWLIGEEDVLLVASTGPLDSRLANIESGWNRPGVAADLAEVGAVEPFDLWSLFVGAPLELKPVAAPPYSPTICRRSNFPRLQAAPAAAPAPTRRRFRPSQRADQPAGDRPRVGGRDGVQLAHARRDDVQVGHVHHRVRR